MKIVPINMLPKYGVLCHGTFDVLHIGHMRLLKWARTFLPSGPLIVTITGDDFVNKGQGRPINAQFHRAEFMEMVDIVDWISIVESPHGVPVIESCLPAYFCKGKEKMIVEEERLACEKAGCKVRFMDYVTPHSTTSVMQAMKELEIEQRSWQNALE